MHGLKSHCSQPHKYTHSGDIDHKSDFRSAIQHKPKEEPERKEVGKIGGPKLCLDGSVVAAQIREDGGQLIHCET